MSDAPQLSVIITPARHVSALSCLCQSLTRQQNAPPFEVLVVCASPNPKVERLMQGFDWRFRYICADTEDVNGAWQTALQVAVGEVAVFVDSECRIDEPLFLRQHFEQHQRSSAALGLSGRMTLFADANIFQTACFWMLDFWLSQARVDSLRCTHLSDVNYSFKTQRIREFLASGFGDPITHLKENVPLDAMLVAAGHELQLVDRLTVDYRPNIHLAGLLERAFVHGRSRQAIEQRGFAPFYRYPGSRLSLRRNLIERGGKMSRTLGLLFWLTELGEQVGYNTTGDSTLASAKTSAILRGTAKLAWRRLLMLPFSRTATELFFALRYSIFRL